MRLLHTSDWHLGQSFLGRDRGKEHESALDWLLELIREESVEGLIVAGDIFDTGTPPNSARRLYYNFLVGLSRTKCRHVLIIGGNHDSPSMLEASGDLLRALNIQVFGASPELREEAILEWKDPEDRLEAVVAAVPFLRERDLHYSRAGESGFDRVLRVQQAMADHYAKMGYLLEKYQKEKVPLLTTGHLYATGAQASDKQDNIYLGNIENISAASFPEIFDYVALGHIHRAQAVGGRENIRYSGSLIPLSFSETKDDKGVYLVDLDGKSPPGIKFMACPVFRRLKTIQGSPEIVREKLERFKLKPRALASWVELVLEVDQWQPGLEEKLLEMAEDENVQILRIRILQTTQGLGEKETELRSLNELSPEEVFLKRCQQFGRPPEEQEELLQTFQELQAWMHERNEE